MKATEARRVLIMMTRAAAGLLLGVLAACQPTPQPPGPPDLFAGFEAGNYTLVDLTHPFYEGMVAFQPPPPLGQGPEFKLETISEYDDRGPWWYWNWFQLTEHTGTHVDAPNHWFSGEGKEAVDEISLELLVGPAVVVDVKAQAQENPDYMLSVQDLESWEQEHGEIPAGAVIVMNSGWHAKYSDPQAFLGLDEQGEIHFPGFSPAAIRWLLENRDINAVASDSISTDALGVSLGTDPPNQVHIEMHRAGKYQIEVIANVDALPATGAYLVIAPMKIQGGSGAPSRIIGFAPA